MNILQKILIAILVLAGVSIVAVAAGYFIANQQMLFYTQNPGYTACTQEAKVCPDGSYVGRTGPNCEFTQCPAATVCTQDAKQCDDGSYVSRQPPNCEFAQCPVKSPNEKTVTLQEGQREASLLVQKIYPTYITGLNFPEYPIATNQGYPITLNIGESASNGCTIKLTLKSISGSAATFIETTDFNRPCPICLAENTLIDTPEGKIPVQDLQKGMAVWSVDKAGNKTAATIIKTSKTPVAIGHQMVHIILKDGRELFASLGHPIGDGRIFNDLFVGDMLDGSSVIIAEKVPYDKVYTYDILPDSETGFYWAGHNSAPGSANGILIDSTLH